MSYEHCDVHDEDATNGCESCMKLWRMNMAHEITNLLHEADPVDVECVFGAWPLDDLTRLEILYERVKEGLKR